MKRRAFLQSMAVASVTAGIAPRAFGSNPKPAVTSPTDWKWYVGPWDQGWATGLVRRWRAFIPAAMFSELSGSVGFLNRQEFLGIPPRRFMIYVVEAKLAGPVPECQVMLEERDSRFGHAYRMVYFQELFIGTHTIVEGVFS